MKKTKRKNLKKEHIILLTAVGGVCTVILLSNIFGGVVPSNKKATMQKIFSSKKVNRIYESEEAKQKFITCHRDVQEKVVTWIFSNLTGDKNSFEEKRKEANKLLHKKEYAKLGIEESSVDFWVGEYSLDETGKLVFTFGNDKMAPSWKDSNETKDMIK